MPSRREDTYRNINGHPPYCTCYRCQSIRLEEARKASFSYKLVRNKKFWAFITSLVAFLILLNKVGIVGAIVISGTLGIFILCVYLRHKEGSSIVRPRSSPSSIDINLNVNTNEGPTAQPKRGFNTDLYIPKVSRDFYIPRRRR